MTSEAWGWHRDPTTGTLRWARTVREYPSELEALRDENKRLRELTDEMTGLLELLADHPAPRRSVFGDIVLGLATLKKERLDKAKET